MIILALMAFVPRSYEHVIRLGFRGSMVFYIEKPCVLVTTLLSLELDVCHPHG
jgi:hypothetical protein